MPLPLKALLSYNLPPRRRPYTTAWHAARNGVGGEEGNSSSGSLDQTALRKLVARATELHDKNLASSSLLSGDALQSLLADLERESADPSFWDAVNARRQEVVTRDLAQYGRLQRDVELWGQLRADAVGALELLEELLSSDGAEAEKEMVSLTADECESCAQQLLDLSQKYELTTLLSGEYDAADCRLILTAGAGGTEACDWVAMLYRMYSRHAEHLGMKVTTLDSSAGDVVGYRSVELLVEGDNAYGWFRGEKGAHRLVRLSPFNANNKRQTTFAGVDVAPVLEDDDALQDVDIPEKELEVSTMRSGGKGGQNVNKVETGVRIRHVPTGIAVRCTQERSQMLNRQLALTRLKAQLLAIAEEQRLASVQAIRGDAVEASWGAQIRNYVLQPYKMVKDTRSGWETSDVDGVLDGGKTLEEFMGAWLRWKREKEAKEKEEKKLEI